MTYKEIRYNAVVEKPWQTNRCISDRTSYNLLGLALLQSLGRNHAERGVTDTPPSDECWPLPVTTRLMSSWSFECLWSVSGWNPESSSVHFTPGGLGQTFQKLGSCGAKLPFRLCHSTDRLYTGVPTYFMRPVVTGQLHSCKFEWVTTRLWLEESSTSTVQLRALPQFREQGLQ